MILEGLHRSVLKGFWYQVSRRNTTAGLVGYTTHMTVQNQRAEEFPCLLGILVAELMDCVRYQLLDDLRGHLHNLIKSLLVGVVMMNS